MKRALLFLVACTALAAAAAADEGKSPFEGKWRGTYETKKGSTGRAEMTIEGQGGSWTYARDHGKWDDACFGLQLPVAVDQVTADELKIHIEGEKLLRGCGKRGASFKLVNGALEGTFADTQRPIKFARP